jgi:hypothetical protein
MAFNKMTLNKTIAETTTMLKRWLLLTALLLASPLYAAGVETDYDTDADFSNLNYYQWQEESDNVDTMYSMLGSGNIEDAMTPSLDQHLILENAQHPADVLVRYYIHDAKQLVDDRPQVGIGIGGMNNNVGGGFSFSFPLGGDKLDKQAHVIIDFIDAKTHKLLWRGSLITGMSSTSTEINQRQVQKATAEILKKFPPH